MDMTEYLENMGITICQRAFFSYMAKPQGSYGLHMIFRLFLKKKRIIMLERDRAGWCRFLADYAVLRLYIARFVLKDFARDYPPLLSIYAGFDRVEKNFPEFLKKEADYIIDTSRLLTRELKTELEKIFVQDEEFNSMYVTILSFGFKYGIPADSDIVMDVRFLPNPYYVEELRPKTGNDVEIQQYVMKYDEAKIFLNKLEDMVTFLIPHYISEGKNQLVISIGCTGGKHRSVTLANELYKRLSQKKNREYGLKIEHRDIGKDALRGK